MKSILGTAGASESTEHPAHWGREVQAAFVCLQRSRLLEQTRKQHTMPSVGQPSQEVGSERNGEAGVGGMPW